MKNLIAGMMLLASMYASAQSSLPIPGKEGHGQPKPYFVTTTQAGCKESGIGMVIPFAQSLATIMISNEAAEAMFHNLAKVPAIDTKNDYYKVIEEKSVKSAQSITCTKRVTTYKPEFLDEARGQPTRTEYACSMLVDVDGNAYSPEELEHRRTRR